MLHYATLDTDAFWLCEARAEPTYRAAIAAAPGYAHAHSNHDSNLPDIHRARVHRR